MSESHDRLNGILKQAYEEREMSKAPVYWVSPVGERDDFGSKIKDTIVDGRTHNGSWALMTPDNFATFGVGLGLGRGQKYKKQKDGKWLKVEG